MEPRLMGAHWNHSGYSKLYQLYRRVELVTRKLDQRRKKKWVPTRKYIAELYDVATQLKVLDMQYSRENRRSHASTRRGRMAPVQKCKLCGGAGKVKDDSGKVIRCQSCGGKGVIVTQ